MTELLNWNGRLGRLDYFMRQLATFAVLFVILLVIVLLLGPTSVIAFSLGAPFAAVALWILMASTVQRLHDLGMSGYHLIWMEAISLVSAFTTDANALGIIFSLASVAVGLWLAFAPGQNFENEYGPVPA